MKVYVLNGGVGGDNCHVEVFEDSERGRELGEDRKRHLQSLNSGWGLEFKLYKVR